MMLSLILAICRVAAIATNVNGQVGYSITYDGHPAALVLTCAPVGSSTITVETRVQDEGFAFRYHNAEGGEFAEDTRVLYPEGTRAWAIDSTEATYPAEPLEIKTGAKEWMTPLTVRSGKVYSSLFDAYAVHYPRIRVVPFDGGVRVKLLQAKPPIMEKGAFSPWRALQLAASPAELLDASNFILDLNPPPNEDEMAKNPPIPKPGLTISNLSNTKLNNEDIIASMRSAKKLGAKYLQIDWGWYGTERAWTDEDCERYLVSNPSMRDEPTWRGNATGNARREVHGYVPYLPQWARVIKVDLDFSTLIPQLKELGIGLCLYIRGKVMEGENLDELFALYRSWGVVGIKPGFVRYGDAESTDWNRMVVAKAAKYGLWVDIHDKDIPDGMQRTYPNLFIMEGCGGEEGRHPVRQELTMPFARGLVGPCDFTPMAFTFDRSHAHQLAMLLCYDGPTAVLRGNMTAIDTLDGKDTPFAWGSERDFVKALPWEYDESRTLEAEIGTLFVKARRHGKTWYVAGMSGENEERIKLNCGFLTPNIEYRMRIWRDDFAGINPRPTIEEARRVDCSTVLPIAMAPSGGFMAIFEPIEASENRRETCLSGAGWTCDGKSVVVPHTWNVVDGSDGMDVPKNQRGHDSASSKSYWRGAKTYRRELPAPKKGMRQFVRCEGVSIKAKVKVNGREVGQHVGAFAAFTFEITEAMRAKGNMLEIEADNSYDPTVPPNEGDFTMCGGVYRDVWYIETPQMCVDPLREIRTWPDADTGKVKIDVPVSGGEDMKLEYTIAKPKLWSPEAPQLYTVAITAGTDVVKTRFGFRKLEWKDGRLYLNGKARQLRGVCCHQDRKGKGWAVSAADEAEDIAIIKNMGADAIRTSHYPRSRRFYDLCDERGLLVWTEIPIVDEVPAESAFRENALMMMREMVEQNANHPSIFAWGLYNEVYQYHRESNGLAEKLAAECKRIAKGIDPTRITLAASNRVSAKWKDIADVPDELGVNLYPGWYFGFGKSPEAMGSLLTNACRDLGRKSVAVSEYGGGASPEHHADALIFDGNTKSRFHSEEYQAWLHYGNYMKIAENPLAWGSFAWVMFDAASDSRQEGANCGWNDKGLVTGDRKTLKDAYYFYKSNWSSEPVLHMVGERERFTTNATMTVVVFTSNGGVTMRLNGKFCGDKTAEKVNTCVWENVPLKPGVNEIKLSSGVFNRKILKERICK